MNNTTPMMNKRDFFKTLTATAIAVPVAAVTAKMAAPTGSHAPESAIDRILSSGIIRAGWFEEPPFTLYDANTQKRRGVAINIIERFAEDYRLKIEWQTISNFAMMTEDLALKKYDVIAASLINMPREGRIDCANAFAFVPVYGYVRKGEQRFSSLADVDREGVTIAGQDGTAVSIITQKRYHKAKHLMLNNADLIDMLVSVATHKADVAFLTPSFYEDFNRKNPGQLQPLNNNDPLQMFSFSFGIKPQEEGLKSLLNNSLHRVLVSGELDQWYQEFDPDRTIIRPSRPFTL